MSDYAGEAIAQGSQSFAAAARLFPPAMRRDVTILYAWCRHCDDVVDGQASDDQPVQLPARPVQQQHAGAVERRDRLPGGVGHVQVLHRPVLLVDERHRALPATRAARCDGRLRAPAVRPDDDRRARGAAAGRVQAPAAGRAPLEQDAVAGGEGPVLLDRDEVRHRVLSALAEEARSMLDEGVVVAAEDLDLAMITGAGFAFWNGGLTPLLDRTGVSEAVTGRRFHGPGVASVPPVTG